MIWIPRYLVAERIKTPGFSEVHDLPKEFMTADFCSVNIGVVSTLVKIVSVVKKVKNQKHQILKDKLLKVPAIRIQDSN